jgi:hypothetical protein
MRKIAFLNFRSCVKSCKLFFGTRSNALLATFDLVSKIISNFQPPDQKFDLVPKHTFDLVKFDLVIISQKKILEKFIKRSLNAQSSHRCAQGVGVGDGGRG